MKKLSILGLLLCLALSVNTMTSCFCNLEEVLNNVINDGSDDAIQDDVDNNTESESESESEVETVPAGSPSR